MTLRARSVKSKALLMEPADKRESQSELLSLLSGNKPDPPPPMSESITLESPLLTLPGEIRNQIWEEVLRSATPVPIVSEIYMHVAEQDYVPKRSLKIAQQPAAALVCETLRTEVLSIYYSVNTFSIPRICCPSPRYVQALMRWRDRAGAKYPRSLELEVIMTIGGEERGFMWSGKVSREGLPLVRLTDGLKDYCVCGVQGKNFVVDAAIEALERAGQDVREQFCVDCWRLELI